MPGSCSKVDRFSIYACDLVMRFVNLYGRQTHVHTSLTLYPGKTAAPTMFSVQLETADDFDSPSRELSIKSNGAHVVLNIEEGMQEERKAASCGNGCDRLYHWKNLAANRYNSNREVSHPCVAYTHQAGVSKSKNRTCRNCQSRHCKVTFFRDMNRYQLINNRHSKIAEQRRMTVAIELTAFDTNMQNQ